MSVEPRFVARVFARLWLWWRFIGSADAHVWSEHAAYILVHGLDRAYEAPPGYNMYNHPPIMGWLSAFLVLSLRRSPRVHAVAQGSGSYWRVRGQRTALAIRKPRCRGNLRVLSGGDPDLPVSTAIPTPCAPRSSSPAQSPWIRFAGSPQAPSSRPG